MIIRTAVMVCALVLVSGCTIKPSSGMLACDKSADCPAAFVCRQVAANDVKRCVDPQTPAWQPDETDAGDAGGGMPGDGSTPDAGDDAGYAANGPDAGDGGRDAGSTNTPDTKDGGVNAPVDSGIIVSGEVTVLQSAHASSASIHVTEAAIEVQPTVCGPSGGPSNKQICVTGGIRP